MRRFDAMREELSDYRVKIIGLSKDDVKTAARQKLRDNISVTLLSDEKLDVIRRYGLEHHKAVQFSGAEITILGLSLGLFPSFKTMAIPTTLLVDENGVIQWIDQADDYRIRSSEARVMQAVKSAFPRSATEV